MSSNALPNVALQTNPSVAKHAVTSGKPNRAKVVVAAVAVAIRVQVAAVAAVVEVIPRADPVRCSRQRVPAAVRLLKFLSNRLEIVRFIAVIASRHRSPVAKSIGRPEPYVVSGA
jgi:hypothetical protein